MTTINKLISIQEAAQLVKTGDTMGLGGMTMYRRPMAFVTSLLARENQPQGLTLLAFTAGIESDLLVGAGLIHKTRTCYFGLETFGLAPMFTDLANRGEIIIQEETENSLAMGIRAKMAGVGFMPAFAWMGTDLMTLRPDIKTVDDPYTDETYVAFPAIECDVAIIHATKADYRGNAILNDNLGVDVELALIADKVIITAEDVVEKITEKVDIVSPVVTAVVEAKQGAYPTSCYPHYPIAGGAILNYIEACNKGTLDRYIQALAEYHGIATNY